MIGIIGTWKMSFRGVSAALEMLKAGENGGDALARAITDVENDPSFTSVGYGGLPDADGHVLTDAAYMDGRTLRLGAVISAENIANPILLARALCGRETNCVLSSRGAELAAVRLGLSMRDMRTEESMRRWREETSGMPGARDAYRGHDTVCVLTLDACGNMYAGTSTSGLFLKAPGRVGDSPLVGSGFYCDNTAAAAATGLGEDIMRGCLSYEVVSLIRSGTSPNAACQKALGAFVRRKISQGENEGSISLIALSANGEFGAATTLSVFPFVFGNSEGISLYAADNSPASSPRRVKETELEGEP